MKNKWNFKLIAGALKRDGYFVFENYFSNTELKEIKSSLLETLNYIKPSKQKDLQKKYYEIKKFNKRLKGNWYNLAPYNIKILQSLHKKEMTTFIQKFFKASVIFLKNHFRPTFNSIDFENNQLIGFTPLSILTLFPIGKYMSKFFI